MEKLILKCGRFVPADEGDALTRIRTLEAHLSRLTEEMERLLAALDEALEDRAKEVD